MLVARILESQSLKGVTLQGCDFGVVTIFQRAELYKPCSLVKPKGNITAKIFVTCCPLAFMDKICVF